ncbi:MAG: hypothetical protein ACXW3L_05920 [Limisphaerales bacterium]
MNDRWSELARQARRARRTAEEEAMPPGFANAVFRRLAKAQRDQQADAWLPFLRPAFGLACATAILCVLLQVRGQNNAPESLLVETENLIRFAVLE